TCAQWHGLGRAARDERWPEERAGWRAGGPSPGCGIGHVGDLAERVAQALRDVAERHAGGTIVVSTHGGAARAGCGALLGWPLDMLRTVGVLSNCHWTDLRFDTVRGWQLRGYNLSA